MSVLRKIADNGAHLLRKGVHKSREERVDPKLDPVLQDAGERILRFAEEVRRVGSNGRESERASSIARRLEQTADYLKYRPASHVAQDAVKRIDKKHVAGVAGIAGVAICGTALAYRYWKSS